MNQKTAKMLNRHSYYLASLHLKKQSSAKFKQNFNRVKNYMKRKLKKEWRILSKKEKNLLRKQLHSQKKAEIVKK